MDGQQIAPDERTLAAYLSDLRSGQPTPGGGSASAYCGALGASLAAMVCRLTIGRAPDDVIAELTKLVESFDDIVNLLSQAARNDEACFSRYQAATKLPKDTDEQKRVRTTARQDALQLAAAAPLAAGEIVVRALRLLPAVAKLGTRHALSDVEVARTLLLASLEGCLINVQVNLDMITDESVARSVLSQMTELRDSASARADQIGAELALRNG